MKTKTRVIKILKRDLTDPDCDRASGSDCLIARALKRIIKPEFYVSVGVTNINIWNTNVFDTHRIAIPGNNGTRVFRARTPFSFKLALPVEVLA